MNTTENVSWNDIENWILSLSNEILKLPRSFSSITTLSRGGLIPSRLLADILDIKKIHVDQIAVSSDSLFVDDIFDTGRSFDDVLLRVDDSSKFIFATLFARRGMKYPDQLIYGKQTLDDSYVVFPWDKIEYEKSLKWCF